MKSPSWILIMILLIMAMFAGALVAAPELVARPGSPEFIIEPVNVDPSFDFWSMFEGASWFQKILLYLPFFTSLIFVLDKIVKWTPNKYDDVIVAFFKTAIAALTGYKNRKKLSRG